MKKDPNGITGGCTRPSAADGPIRWRKTAVRPDVSAVLFDLDETLTDRASSIASYAVRLFRDFADCCGDIDISRVIPTLVEADGAGYNHRRFELMARMSVWVDPPSEVALNEHWQEYFPAHTVGRDGVVEVLEAIQAEGLDLGLITNGKARFQNRKIDALGIREYLSTVVISEEAGVAKPDAGIFHMAVEALGKRAESCAFVGDHPVNDVDGASKAKLWSVWFRGGVPWPAELAPPAFEVSSLQELYVLLSA